MARQKNEVSEMSYCLECKIEHKKIEFYKSYNELYNGVLPFCKNAIKKKVYSNNGQIDIEVFKDILRQMDIPFLIDYWNTAVENDMETIGCYFKDMSLKQNRELKWKDSKFEIREEKNNNRNSYEFVDLEKLEEKWGFGYTSEELNYFEKKYNLLKNNYNEKTAMHSEALLTYIRYRVKEELATAKGDVKEAKEWGQLASKAATDAKINPSQLSKADLSDGLSTFSELSQAIEKEVDIIPILPRFKYRPNDAIDFNIWCYINYIRDLEGKPPCDYEDVYKFYDKRKADYVKQYGDPYGIFSDDTSQKNRENIKKFIEEDGSE